MSMISSVQFQNEHHVSSKKIKLQNRNSRNNIFLNSEIVSLFCQFLTHKDIIIFELVASSHRYITTKAWQEKGYNIDWHDTEGMEFKAKNNYILCFLFSNALSLIPTNFLLAEIFQEKFEKFQRFSNFYATIKFLVYRAANFNIIDNPEMTDSLRKIANIAFEGIIHRKWTGDILLQGLITLLYPVSSLQPSDKEKRERLAKDYFVTALDMGIMFAPPVRCFSINSIREELAIACARKKIFSTLEAFLYDLSIEQLHQMKTKYGPLGPIMLFIAQKSINPIIKTKEDLIQLEQIYDEVYKNYENKPTDKFLEFYIYLKIFLNRFDEVKSLWKIFQNISKNLGDRISINFYLNNLDESFNLCKQPPPQYQFAASYSEVHLFHLFHLLAPITQGLILLLRNDDTGAEKFFTSFFNTEICKKMILAEIFATILLYNKTKQPEKVIKFLANFVDEKILFEVAQELFKPRKIGIEYTIQFILPYNEDLIFYTYNEWNSKSKIYDEENLKRQKIVDEFIETYKKKKNSG